MLYTEEYIAELFQCEKIIIEPPAKDYKKDRSHRKKNFKLSSIDGKFHFKAFIRYNVHFPENFSVGLDYNPKYEKGTILIFRCNGPHGENRHLPHHVHYHIHKASAETINSGARPESNIEATDKYATLEQAIQYFLKEINVNKNDRYNYFPNKPLELFEENE